MFSGMGNTLRMSIWLFCRWGCERLAHRCISIIEWNICSKAASFHVLTSLLCLIKIDLSFLKKNEADQTRNLRSACLSLRRKEKGKKRLSMSFAMQKKKYKWAPRHYNGRTKHGRFASVYLSIRYIFFSPINDELIYFFDISNWTNMRRAHAP